MWFKSVRLYRLPAPWQISKEKLQAGLSNFAFSRCNGQDMQSFGWLAPCEDSDLVHAVGVQWLLCLGLEQKILPTTVINQVADEKVSEIEALEGYRLGRKQIQEIRELTRQELLPRAFTVQKKQFLWIDPTNGWLVIDAASAAKADLVIEALIKSIDDIELGSLHTEISPMQAMFGWLSEGEAAHGFTIDRDCELKSPAEDKSIVRYIRHNLDDNQEVINHLMAGKQPTKLAMTWQDKISFILTEHLEIKRLQFLDLILEQSEKQSSNSRELFDSDFALMTGELSLFIKDLVDALGGEVERTTLKDTNSTQLIS